MDWDRIRAALIIYTCWLFSALTILGAWASAMLELEAPLHIAIVVFCFAASFGLFFVGYEILRKELAW